MIFKYVGANIGLSQKIVTINGGVVSLQTLIPAQTNYSIIRWLVGILRALVEYSFMRATHRPLIARLNAMKLKSNMH